MTETREPSRTPSFAASSILSSVNASMAMKIDIVKPIPANSPIRQTPPQDTPGASRHQPVRTASQVAAITPIGFPAQSASPTPSVTN